MADSEPSPVPGTPPPDPYATWRNANFRLYAVNWFAMTMARQIEFLAVGIYLYGPKKDLLALGWQGVAMALPMMLLAIAGGQLADRFDRRRVLASMLCLTAGEAVALCAACYYHLSAPWIYLLLVINGVGQTLGAPSRTALLPWIVPPEQFARAVTWNTTVFQIATMVGPAAGGFLLSTSLRHGVPIALAFVVLFRLLGLAGTLLLRTDRPQRKQASISRETLVAGIRFVRSQKPILATISLDLFAVLLGGATFVLPAIADQVLGFHDEATIGAVVGYLRAAEAAGAISMAILLAHLPPFRRAGRTMLWAVAGFGASTVCLGFSKYLWIALAAMFLIGALDNISVVVRHTLIQLLTPDDMRGRVTAVSNVFITASNELGGAESGLTAYWFGLVPSVVGGGVGAILVVLGCAAVWPQILSIGSLAGLRPEDDAKVRPDSEEEIAVRE
jgi:MFS family permease